MTLCPSAGYCPHLPTTSHQQLAPPIEARWKWRHMHPRLPDKPTVTQSDNQFTCAHAETVELLVRLRPPTASRGKRLEAYKRRVQNVSPAAYGTSAFTDRPRASTPIAQPSRAQTKQFVNLPAAVHSPQPPTANRPWPQASGQASSSLYVLAHPPQAPVKPGYPQHKSAPASTPGRPHSARLLGTCGAACALQTCKRSNASWSWSWAKSPDLHRH